jgi:hypothetical protein
MDKGPLPDARNESVSPLDSASPFLKTTLHTNSLIHKYCFYTLGLARASIVNINWDWRGPNGCSILSALAGRAPSAYHDRGAIQFVWTLCAVPSSRSRPNIQQIRPKTRGPVDPRVPAPGPTKRLPGHCTHGEGSAALEPWPKSFDHMVTSSVVGNIGSVMEHYLRLVETASAVLRGQAA